MDLTPTKIYDCIIIGGGINGVGIALELALQNCNVLLLEKQDIGSGTSCKSSKLVHGGLRYLEKGRLELVKEALTERRRLLNNAPHLVKPQPFIVPIYRHGRWATWQLKIGLWLYSLLAGKQTVKAHRFLNREEVLALEPSLTEEGLMGGALYYDAVMDDARLCIEIAISAKQAGADIKTYTTMTAIKKGEQGAHIVTFNDNITGETYHAKGQAIIVTVGAWTDQWIAENMSQTYKKKPPVLSPSKGSHLITRKLTDHALLLTTTADKRVFFIIPYGQVSIIGTTDTPFKGDLESLDTTEKDSRYLLDSVNRAFPSIKLEKKDVLGVFSGIRPLIKGRSSVIGGVSREEKIIPLEANVWAIVGGKYTTYRAVSEKVARKVLKNLFPHQPFKSKTRDWSFYGNAKQEHHSRTRKEHEKYAYLKERYGCRYERVLTYISKTNDRKIVDISYLEGEVCYMIHEEFVEFTWDILRRRTQLVLQGQATERAVNAIRALIAQEKRWTEERIKKDSELTTKKLSKFKQNPQIIWYIYKIAE